MNNEPVAWMYEKPNGASKLSFVKEKMLWEDMTETPLYTHPVKEEHFEDEPQAEELHEIMQSNTHPVKEQDESFDRTASHMAGEYVSYQKELTDEEILKVSANKFLMSEHRLVLLFARELLRKAQNG